MPSGKRRHLLHFQKRQATGHIGREVFVTEDGAPLVDDDGAQFLAAEGEEVGGPADPYGNPESGDFTTQFTEWCAMKPLRGGEQVLGDRLRGVQPYAIEAPSNSRTRGVTTDWRLVDAHNGRRIFNVRQIDGADGKNRIVNLLAESGVAT